MGKVAVALLSVLVAVEVIAILVIATVLFVVGTGLTTLVAVGMLVVGLASCLATALVIRRGRGATG